MQNILIYLGIVLIMLQAGCVNSYQTESSSPEFGSSVRMAVRNQIAFPEAGGDAPVTGMDGRKSSGSADQYLGGHYEFKEGASGPVSGGDDK